MNSRLRGDLTAKVHQLTTIEKTIVEEQEHYRWTKSDNTSRIRVISSEGEARIVEMHAAIKQGTVTVSGGTISAAGVLTIAR